MKQLKKLLEKPLKIALALTLVLSSQPASAQDCKEVKRTCDEVIRTADILVKSLKLTVSHQDALIAESEKLTSELERALAEEKSRSDAWYNRNEVIAPVSLTVGLLLGILLVK